MHNIKTNKENIDKIAMFAHNVRITTRTEELLKEKILLLESLAHGINNSLAVTQLQADELAKHNEELSDDIHELTEERDTLYMKLAGHESF